MALIAPLALGACTSHAPPFHSATTDPGGQSALPRQSAGPPPALKQAAAVSYDYQLQSLNYYTVNSGQVAQKAATQPLPGCSVSKLGAVQGDVLVLCRAGGLSKVRPGQPGVVASTMLGADSLGFARGRDVQVDGVVPDSVGNAVFVYGRVATATGDAFSGFLVQLDGSTLRPLERALVMPALVVSAVESEGKLLALTDEGAILSFSASVTSGVVSGTLPPGVEPRLLIGAAGGGTWAIAGAPGDAGLVATPSGRLVRTPRLDFYAGLETSQRDLLIVHREDDTFSLMRVTRDGEVGNCGKPLPGQPLAMIRLAPSGNLLVFLHGPHGQVAVMNSQNCLLGRPLSTPKGEVLMTALPYRTSEDHEHTRG